MKIELVEQKHKKGCGVACLAMVTGKTYDEIASDFVNDFNFDGMSSQQAIDYLGDLGFGVIFKEVKYYPSVEFGRDEILKPFAPAHLVAIRTKFDGSWHFVVMNSKGKLLCPGGMSEEEIKSAYAISEVIGVYER